MKISINSIISQGYQDIFKLPMDELAEKIGAQLGALDEEPFYLGALYDGALVAKVVSCEKHPDADKLSVCLIDDDGAVKDVERNSDGLIQVVCGAPNVASGQTVCWLPPGMIVPASVGEEPFKLTVREIRGIKSNGMIASPSELAISDDHSGILEISAEDIGEPLMKPGTPFKQLYGLDDYILNIENKMFTHRPDCFGLLGVAREIAGIQGLAFESPDWYQSDVKIDGSGDLKLGFVNEVPELAPRFVLVPMSGVKVARSPIWLQSFLTRHGLRPINNVVDLTNYFMLLTAQPLHAYDYDKVKALSGGDATIVVRNPKPGEKLKLLNGKAIEPRSEAILIATDKVSIGLGGIMGGAETEVDDSTQNIILEVANFDMYSVRRTAMAHGLFTDAVTRFNKGQSPLQNMAVAAKAVELIAQIAGGQVAGLVIDDVRLDKAIVERNSLHVPVTVSAQFINERLGLQLPADDMKKLLENVEFEVQTNDDDLVVKAPFWRTDIELREDVVEEVGRLYGYDHLPLELPRRDLTPASHDPLLTAKAAIRAKLSQSGANEVLTYSFVHGDLMEKVGQDPAKAFQVANALSPDLQYYRLSLMPSLLDKVHPNIKAGYDEFALCEIGKTHDLDHVDKDGLPEEFEFTGLVVAAADKLKKAGAPYYQARAYLEVLTDGQALEFKPIGKDMKDYPVVQPYDLKRSALVSFKSGDFLGIIGEFKPSALRNLKLPRYTAGFEIDTKVIQKVLAEGAAYIPLSRFPNVKQDLTLKVKADMPYAEVAEFVNKQLVANAPDDSEVGVEAVGAFQKDDDSKNLTFHIIITGNNRTLTEQEVSATLDAVVAAGKEIGAVRA